MDKRPKASEILNIDDPNAVLHYVRSWSSELSEKEHVIKSVILEIHHNSEVILDKILYKLLTYGTPKGTTSKDVDEVEKEIWEAIGSINFEQKFRLLKPILKKWKQARPEVSEIKIINDIRRQCAHLKNKNKIKYKGYAIFSEPEGLAVFFLDSWGINKGLQDLWEWIDDYHARNEKALKFAYKKGGI
ncbi:MAG: hypothetical protein ABH882_06825 [Candidatus Omnitrophota bacterium]|nr:hypothetical protein [Candidatus Omnitrophota bacterium]MBU1928599.1 hypothetical protein [Candidatus Omnitrophota bacterium]MBU2034612.1 hypothetical protein [Candidatus Omnitrophota bacterium]MBU2221137.1 hypothetical protein [Candidatus Omnitrophota bacterium]MBU2258428.1 hypothetical protein [Candidatus Omnitrophota bacterium]